MRPGCAARGGHCLHRAETGVQHRGVRPRRGSSPAGLVPVLLDDEFAIWDSLAICEYLADRHPEAGLWPAQPRRARARSLAAQMHSRAAPGHAAERGAPARRRILRRRPAGHLPDTGPLAGRARAVRPGRTVPVRRFTIADAFTRRCPSPPAASPATRAPWMPCWRTRPCRNGSATRRPKRPPDRNRGALRRLAARQRAAGPHQTGARSIAQAVAHEDAQQSHRRRLGAAGQRHQRELRSPAADPASARSERMPRAPPPRCPGTPRPTRAPSPAGCRSPRNAGGWDRRRCRSGR